MLQGKSILFLLCLILFSDSILAQPPINAVKDGMWSDPDTWDGSDIPQSNNEVTINGFEVFLDVDATVRSITITNAAGDNSKLDLNGTGVVLSIEQDLTVINECNQSFGSDFYIRDQDSVYVGGMVNFSRSEVNANNGSCNMKLAGDARLTVDKDYTYSYGSSGLSEAGLELQLLNTSIVEIRGNLNMTTDDGNGITAIIEDQSSLIVEGNTLLKNVSGLGMLFNVKETAEVIFSGDFTIDNSKTAGFDSYNFVQIGDNGGSMDIGGDLNLISIKDAQRSKIKVNGVTAWISIAGDINFTGTGDQDLLVDVEAGATLYLGGGINRSSGAFGDLAMEADTRIVYNGDAAQTIPENVASGAGLDAFQFANVVFDNDSGMPLTLSGPMTVEKELVLTKGILQSSAAAPVIIAENATVSGGSTLAYIDGPIIKEGAIVGDSFLFPVGDMGVYAPFEINVPKSSATAEYTAQYLSCPPPLSGAIGTNLTTISGTGHWVYYRSATSPEADVTMHWNDANLYGITDTSDLRVAVYHPDSSAWVSIGKSVIEDNGDNTGHITNALSCPPPLSGSLYTFGSEKGNNALPVVLSAFQATPRGQVVEISWETASEFNSDFFEIEKSSDGLHFRPIEKVNAIKNADQLTKYLKQDINPEKGENYYRLCQVDNMGMKVYSRIVLANFESVEATSVFPNPVKDVLHVKGDFVPKVYDLEIYDAAGRMITQLATMGEKGFLKFKTNDLNLPFAGVYFMRINNNGTQQTIPFIKD